LAPNRGSGSGVIFETNATDGSALVLTNFHVIEGASRVDVVVNDRITHVGAIQGTDPARDLAVVRICCGGFQAAPFGDAAGLKVGAEVVAIGYALGIPGSATVTRGIVSAVRFEGDTQRWVIQTDAPMNPGNSGGPLFSTSGQVMGINTFKVAATREGRLAEGLGFAVSEVTVREQLPRLKVRASAASP
jgi:S1-C subfamily serine protease